MSIKKGVMIKDELDPVGLIEVSCEIEIEYDENNRKSDESQPDKTVASDCDGTESESERHYIRFDDDEEDMFYLSESDSSVETSREEIDSIEQGMMLIFDETVTERDVKKKTRNKIRIEHRLPYKEVPPAIKEEVIDLPSEQSGPNLVAGCKVNACVGLQDSALSCAASQPSVSVSGNKCHLGPNDSYASIASSDNIEPLMVVVRNVDSDKPSCEPLKPSRRPKAKPKVKIRKLAKSKRKVKTSKVTSSRSLPLRDRKVESAPSPAGSFPRICLKDTMPLHCVLCNIECTNRRALIEHVKSHSTDKKSFECPTCKKTFTQQCNLKRHMRCHSGERPFSCPYCKKLFADQGYLTTHLRYHTNTKPYTCQHCEKTFFDRSNYVKHLKSHSGEKPYPCSVCNKSFLQQSDLTRHTRVHSGERPFKCDHCDRSFTQHGDLTTHLRHHTGERPFVCSDCQKTFANKRYLNSHVKGRICLKKAATSKPPSKDPKLLPVLTKRLTVKKVLK